MHSATWPSHRYIIWMTHICICVCVYACISYMNMNISVYKSQRFFVFFFKKCIRTDEHVHMWTHWSEVIPPTSWLHVNITFIIYMYVCLCVVVGSVPVVPAPYVTCGSTSNISTRRSTVIEIVTQRLFTFHPNVMCFLLLFSYFFIPSRSIVNEIWLDRTKFRDIPIEWERLNRLCMFFFFKLFFRLLQCYSLMKFELLFECINLTFEFIIRYWNIGDLLFFFHLLFNIIKIWLYQKMQICSSAATLLSARQGKKHSLVKWFAISTNSIWKIK